MQYVEASARHYAIISCGLRPLAMKTRPRDPGLALGPGCAAEGMAVPLAVKELRPLRGAFGVLDREPPARHRQNGGAGRSLPQETPRSPLTALILGPVWDHASRTR